jgi:positive regulator of sigma E activity
MSDNCSAEGTVISAATNSIEVELTPSSCSNCGLQKACHGGSGKKLTINLPEAALFTPGENVNLSVESIGGFRLTAIIFGAGLAVAALAALAAQSITGMQTISAAVFIAASLGWVAVAAKITGSLTKIKVTRRS